MIFGGQIPKTFHPLIENMLFFMLFVDVEGFNDFFPKRTLFVSAAGQRVRRLTRKLGQARPRGEPAGPAGGAPAGVRRLQRPPNPVAGLSLAPRMSHLCLALTCASHVSLAPRIFSHLCLVEWWGG